MDWSRCLDGAWTVHGQEMQQIFQRGILFMETLNEEGPWTTRNRLNLAQVAQVTKVLSLKWDGCDMSRTLRVQNGVSAAWNGVFQERWMNRFRVWEDDPVTTIPPCPRPRCWFGCSVLDTVRASASAFGHSCSK